MPFWKNVFHVCTSRCVHSAGSRMRDARHASGKRWDASSFFFLHGSLKSSREQGEREPANSPITSLRASVIWYFMITKVDNYQYKYKFKSNPSDDVIIQLSKILFLNYRYYNAYRKIQAKFYYQKTRSRITLIRRKWLFRSVIPENYIKIDNKIEKVMHCVGTVYLLRQYENTCYRHTVLDFNV